MISPKNDASTSHSLLQQGKQASLDISNCTTIIHWTFWFMISDTWVILQNVKCTLHNSTSSSSMNDKENRIWPTGINCHLKVHRGFFYSHTS